MGIEIIKFTDKKEFCEELAKDVAAGIIERGIVRLTYLYEAALNSPQIHSLIVVASYKAAYESRIKNRRPTLHEIEKTGVIFHDIIMLRVYCGQVWEITDQDKPVYEFAEKLAGEIEQFCKDNGIEIRCGSLEEYPRLKK